MLARRIICVSPDKTLGKQISVALRAAGGAVDLHASTAELGGGEIQAALVVLHLDGEVAVNAAALVKRITGETKVIAILPRTSLVEVVDVMRQSERLAGMLVAEDFAPQRLSAMATRVLAGDIFGLDKLIAWGTQIHSVVVGDYQEKSVCISQVSEFAEAMGVRRKYRESIEQSLDEMLMNALYDAPVDEEGRQIFSEIPTKTRISLRVEQKAVVQFACDGKQFAIAVRDAFGRLERETVLKYLHKCLHSKEQIDRKVGGAGLGLYLMTSSSSEVYFNVLPGVATEAVCVFDLEQSKMQLRTFGFFFEKIDASGRLAAGPSRRLPTGTSQTAVLPPAPRGNRAVVTVLVFAILATLGLVGFVAYPRYFGAAKTASVTVRSVPPGATIEVDGRPVGLATGTVTVRDLEVGRAYTFVARLDGYLPKETAVSPREGESPLVLELARDAGTLLVDSVPDGATVQVDGKSLGVTPLSIPAPPGSTLAVVLKKAGFQDATMKLDAPKAGGETRVVVPMSVSLDLARVRVVSEPPGAAITQNGRLLQGVTTPAEILVEAGRPISLVLSMSGKVPATIPTFVPGRGADNLVKTGKLLDGGEVRIAANVDVRVSIAGLGHCQGMAVPASCLMATGNYTMELVAGTGRNTARMTKTFSVAGEGREIKLELGFVEAGSGKLLQISNGPGVRRALFDIGPRRVTVVDDGGVLHMTTVNVKPGGTATAN